MSASSISTYLEIAGGPRRDTVIQDEMDQASGPELAHELAHPNPRRSAAAVIELSQRLTKINAEEITVSPESTPELRT